MTVSDRLHRKLAAILYADVAGYSRLTGEDEDATHRALRDYLDLISKSIDSFRGQVIHYAGDAVLARFDAVVDALSAAVAIQAALVIRNEDLPDSRKVLFRIGVNLGDVIEDRGDIYGDGVNVAARLETLAEPGGICVSEAVRTAVGRKLEVGYEFLGEREVKNIAEPVRAYRVLPLDAIAGEWSGRMPCPYPGMVPFQPEDASHFHGRSAQIDQMVGLLRHQRFMMVIGPSGSGKSSLVQAGLLPELERSRYFAEGFWLVRRMRPGSSPCAELGRIFNIEATAEGPDLESVKILLRAHPPAQRLLLFVDQFEETFAQAEREESARFIAALQGLRTRENLALVLTLRADFYPDLMNSYLWPVDASQRVEVAPLRGDALREAIVRPAADVGVQIEQNLVDRLLADAADEPGVLPLLQETMRQLWDEMDGRTLSLAAYERLSADPNASGLAAAIAMRADATLAELSPEQQAIARRSFLRLVQFGEGRADTRRQQPLSALRAAEDDPTLFERTLEHLTDHRLLTRAGGGNRESATVDIAHESLITGWGRLRQWIEQRRESEQARRRLESKAEEWERLGRGKGGLLDDAALPEAERWLASADATELGFGEALPELIRASKEALEQAEREREEARQRELKQAEALAEEQTRSAGRMRRATLGLAAVFLVAVMAAVLAWIQAERAGNLAEQEALARTEAQRLAEAEVRSRTEAERQRLASIAQLLLIQAPQQKEIGEDERSLLLARQGQLLSGQQRGRLRDQAERTLRTLLSEPYFAANPFSGSSAGIAFSHDGKQFAAYSGDVKKILLWNVSNPGDYIELPLGPGREDVWALAFSPDGEALVGGLRIEGGNKSLLRWNLDEPGAPPEILRGHEGRVASLAFSPDGRYLAAGGDRDITLRRRDSDTAPVHLVNPSANESKADEVWGSVAFGPDGRTLAVGGLDGNITLWDPADPGAPTAVLRGHKDSIESVAFSPDGGVLASGGRDAVVRLWALADPAAAPVILGRHEKPITSLAFSPDGRMLASGGRDSIIRLWDVKDPAPVPLAELPTNGPIWHLAFSPDGTRLASSRRGAPYALLLWDMTPGAEPAIVDAERGALALEYSPDGKLLAAAQRDGFMQIWDSNNLSSPKSILHGHEGWVGSANFGPDGKTLVSSSQDKTVRLWRLGDSPTSIAILRGAQNWVWTALFSPDGGTLAAGGTNGVVRLWDTADLATEPREVRLATDAWISEIAFSPDGGTLAVAAWDGTVHLLDAKRPEENRQILQADDVKAWSVAFSPDGRTLATSGFNGAIRLWDLSAPDTQPTILRGHERVVRRVRFSPDGKRLASVSYDLSVRLWDVDEPGRPPTLLYGHESPVNGMAFSPDGRTLVSGSPGGLILRWDMAHPLMRLTTRGLSDRVCELVWRNLTLDEWRQFVAEDIPYERTCRNLPAHPSVRETAEKLARAGDVDGAVTLFARLLELHPELDLNPQVEAERLAAPGN